MQKENKLEQLNIVFHPHCENVRIKNKCVVGWGSIIHGGTGTRYNINKTWVLTGTYVP